MKSNEFVYTTYIRTTPEKVWSAITNPEFCRQYWVHVNISDWKKGSKWQHMNESTKACMVEGEILESVPPKRLVMTWAEPGSKAKASRVTFEIEKVDDTVKLNVIHVDLEGEMAGKVSKGWPLVLSSMKTFLETNKALNTWGLKQPSCSNS